MPHDDRSKRAGPRSADQRKARSPLSPAPHDRRWLVHVTLVAFFVALAVGLLVARQPAARRLASLRPSLVTPSPPRRTLASLGTPLCAVAGLALAMGIRGPLGVVLGCLLALLGPRLLTRMQQRDATGDREPDALPLALDLLAACLAGGSTPVAAVAAVATATPGSTGERLSHVASSLALGMTPAEAFSVLGDDGPAGAAARTLRRALEGGTPVAAAVARVAEEARHAAALASHARAKRLAVTAIAPLVVCFMPAFFLVGVVPALYGAFAGLLGQIS